MTTSTPTKSTWYAFFRFKARRDRQLMQECVLNGFVPISIQIEEADNIGLGFLVDDDGFVELGGGDA